MQYRPHDYQSFAIQYIKSHSTAAVLLDMGLGKTSICLTALADLLFDEFVCHRILVVAPLRVARDTWPGEIKKWDHLKGLSYSVAVGSEDERLKALKAKADIYIINRENLQWLVEKSGIAFKFDTVVLDELSSFKNHQSKRFKSLMKVRSQIQRIIGLTGTPSSNGLMDLWAEYRVLDMGARLGRYITQYRLKYFQPDKRNGMQVFSYKLIAGAEEQIYKAISDITISMKGTDYLTMPEKVISSVEVNLSEEERSVYDHLKDELVLELKGEEITASNAAALAGKLIQMANGAVYSDDEKVMAIHDRKLEALEELIEEANGKGLLVAYWYKHDKTRITELLKKLGARFSELTTSQSIEDWNNGKLDIGLIHPASSGHGLNLQEGGSTIVWFSLTWSLELYQQTNARLYRQGQKDSTVVIQHIITKDTIDERILNVLQSKDKVQDSLLEAVKAEVRYEA